MSGRYAELREAIRDATPGPWEQDEADGDGTFFVPSPLKDGRVRWGNSINSDNPDADARYIAAASPDVVAALLAERDALHEALVRIVDKRTLTEDGYTVSVREMRYAEDALDSWIDEEVRAHRREKAARIGEES